MYLLNEQLQSLYRDAVSYGKNYLAPSAERWEEERIFPAQEFERMARSGYLGLNVPRHHGGRGLSFLESALIYQGLSRSNLPFTLAVECHNNMSYELSIFDTSPEVKSLVPRLMEGRELLAFGLTEPEAGSDPNSMSSHAVKTEGGYLLNGTKSWVTNGAEATLFDVTVKDPSAGEKAMKTFLVSIPSEGLEITSKRRTMGGNCISKATIRMKNCFVPESRVISRNGYKDALFSVLIARIFTPAMAIGLCEEMLDTTCRYLARRVQFGKPLLEQQLIQCSLASLKMEVEAGKHLVYHTASCMDHGIVPTEQAAGSKLYCAQVAMKVATTCCQLFGAEGYATGTPIERMFREAKMLSIIDGTSEIQNVLLGSMLAKSYATA